MEMQFQKSSRTCLDAVVSEVKNTEQTQELRLSDGMPDIGRVLAAWAQPILRSKEWTADNISVSGGMTVWVLYAPEDGTEPRCVEGWMPFQLKWDLPEGTPEGKIRLWMLPKFADARSVSARKLMLRAGAAVLAQAYAPVEGTVWTPGELPEDVALLRTQYPLRLPKYVGERSFLLDETLTLPGSAPQPDKLIYYTMSPETTDGRVLGDKAVFRGNGNLHILYRSEEGQLHNWDFPVPFSQYVQLPQSCSGEARVDVGLCVTNLELELDDESHLRLKCGIVGQYLVDDLEMMEIVEDAYSPVREVKNKMQELELPVILETRTENLYGEQTLQADANLAADLRFFPDFPRQYRTDTGVHVETPGQFQMLYYGDNGTLQGASSRWEGTQEYPADEKSKLSMVPLIPSEPQFALSDGSVTLKSQVPMQMTASARQKLTMVTGMELGEEQEPDPGRPSLILHRFGDTGLWQLAKENGSTIQAIRQANKLEGDPTPGQMLLIPVS